MDLICTGRIKTKFTKRRKRNCLGWERERENRYNIRMNIDTHTCVRSADDCRHTKFNLNLYFSFDIMGKNENNLKSKTKSNKVTVFFSSFVIR